MAGDAKRGSKHTLSGVDMEALMCKMDTMDEILALLHPQAPLKGQPWEPLVLTEKLRRPGVAPWAAFLPVKNRALGQGPSKE
ncbi:hypothetical protein NDU88_007444 [Pleurodeles waltl]|uniref:Uncharacterized protein n=1 Tax=Pleurodeles waltl TaxID=8319 RepID=A0AAV7QPW6_PLEWA|nr:hypothetical protein NDU88_007444 [Pleurodeles waltl]